ncbi:tyrosine-type recombinase/integrase [Hoeflea prorocentri]|uniref:Tyrosine-type recombinase/integrase n=2 Tax=Hoeflea prorocentri TaxID=1922333 RepID=A0A9X3UF75_9HYPH|nr:tyrosine-type recombinase/integrase [Hoeflea prorocentri]MCY6380253.1 tyrosine-type recombinase/integrase [Hoeflea prorocentri]MDA5398053.1 tyrosine-type recombinase/integrase [Hoeflea prorocentri]
MKWRSDEIVIAHAKGSRTAAMPPPADVGEAIVDCVAHWRPHSARGRTAFVRFQSPHGPMTFEAVSQVVRRAAQHCGLGGISAHRLRHTAATEMLRNGASLPEVGQVLRHRQMITTAIYAKSRSGRVAIYRPYLAGSVRINIFRKASITLLCAAHLASSLFGRKR